MRIRTNYMQCQQVITLTDDDIIKLLLAAGTKVPAGAKVTLRVPGGGDWSNMDVDVSSNADSRDSLVTISYSMPAVEQVHDETIHQGVSEIPLHNATAFTRETNDQGKTSP